MLKEVKKFGSTAHIIVPKELIGKTVEVKAELILGEKAPITWKDIDKRIENAIYKAKGGY